MTLQNINTIDKENIKSLQWPSEDVLESSIAKIQRKTDLIKSMYLGNNAKRKVKILFEDDQGLKLVETTVWATTDLLVILKAGSTIPMHRIHLVQLF